MWPLFIAGSKEQFKYWCEKLGVNPLHAIYVQDVYQLYGVPDGTKVYMVGLWAQSPVPITGAFNHMVYIKRIIPVYVKEFEPLDTIINDLRADAEQGVRCEPIESTLTPLEYKRLTHGGWTNREKHLAETRYVPAMHNKPLDRKE